jgi:hypothetical protein
LRKGDNGAQQLYQAGALRPVLGVRIAVFRDSVFYYEIEHQIPGRMQILKAGVLYYALVFGAGFVLGTFRLLWVVPRLGTRMAELMETPIMLLVTIVAARWVVGRLAVPSTRFARLNMGCIALGLLLISEFTLVLWLRGLSISEYLASRDPVSGTVYYAALGLFAIMPLLVARR